MNVEFLEDDFGKIWLFNAKDLWIREVNELPTDYNKMFSQFLITSAKKDI